MENRKYIAIDLKSFYASVECVERGLDPMTTNLVVADSARTEKTICLAVSPALKSYGIPGRPRLFEVVSKVKEVNEKRLAALHDRRFSGKSYRNPELQRDSSLALDYIVAPPRMGLYMKRSTEIYNVYLKYVSPEDIHVYSVDEVFIDVTYYLRKYGVSARELAMRMIRDVLQTTGITATAGIGTNLYLCKIAMDIVAKHIPADRDGVRIAELDEMTYRRQLWTHRPLTDFWRVGRGYAEKLEECGIYTMGDIARCSLGAPSDFYNAERLYKMFGINAELLIDHAWGWEPCTIADIKSFRPESNSIGTGQVLQYPYDIEKGRLIVREMTDLLVLDLVDKGLVTDQIVLNVGYDVKCLTDPVLRAKYKGEIVSDHYGRQVPKPAHGSINLPRPTSSTKEILDAVTELYSRIVNKNLLIRRFNVTMNHTVPEDEVPERQVCEQMDIFTDYETAARKKEEEKTAREREKRMQKTLIDIQKKHGKNAILKGMNLEEGATTMDRNDQIGGHKA